MIIIISNFVDYYDHIPKMYGVDQKVVLDRRKKLDAELDSCYRYFSFLTTKRVEISYLVFCNEIYIMEDNDIHCHIDKWLNESTSSFWYNRYTELKNKIPALTKRVGFPYYTLGNRKVDKDVPNLVAMGLNKYYSPEQCYQNIYYFMLNILRPSPDIIPPVELSDAEKIIQHGFDKKRSFRPKMRKPT